MPTKKKLSQLLQMTGLNAKYQDNRILLYNRAQDHLSLGVSVNGFPDAIKLAQEYLGFLRSARFVPLTEFVSDHLNTHGINFHEVPNKVDPQSAYYVAAMSTLSRINLLKAATELRARVRVSQSLREAGVSESSLRRHKKIKRIASIYREDSELVC